jgi:hypothetical protein
MSGSGNMEERTMNIVKILAVGTFLASTLAAGGVLAKAHDQGVKGSFAGNGPGPANETTATAAQGLGAALGDARGFARLSGKK